MIDHRPPDAYADCFRACIASILDLGSPDVPHFYHDGCDGETGLARLTEWLAGRGLTAYLSAYTGEIAKDDLLQVCGANSFGGHYILFGNDTNGVNHCVVCCGAEVVHNPAWGRLPVVAPTDDGHWLIMVIAVR